jgi:uncharacterized membrane protein YciS (DUF1049 family)
MEQHTRERIRARIHYSTGGAPPAGRDFFAALRARAAGPIGRALAVIVGGIMLISALFVSAIVFSVLLVVGAVAGGWFWWKTRGLRREIRERLAQMQQAQSASGSAGSTTDAQASPQSFRSSPGHGRAGADVIDGDFIRDVEEPPAR